MGIAPKNPNPPAWSFGTIPGQQTTTPKGGMVQKEPVTGEDKLKRLISTNFGIDETEVTPNAHLIHDCEFDSLDFTELAIVVEEEFGFEFDEDCDFEKLVTVKQWLGVISKHKMRSKK